MGEAMYVWACRVISFVGGGCWRLSKHEGKGPNKARASGVLLHCVGTPHNETQPRTKGGNHPAFMQASQGSSYPWWLVAVAKHNLLWRKCVGRWWQPCGDIGILP